MEFKKFKQTWGDLNLENQIFRFSLPVLALALLIAVINLSNQSETVVIQHGNTSEELRISENSANSAYLKSYGLHVASVLGNVHPGSAEFLVNTMQHMMHPSVYHEMRQEIINQVRVIESDNLTISYEIVSIDYWDDTNRVVISGNQRTRGRGDGSVRQTITYEMEVEVQNYRPLVTYINSYEGAPERD